MNVRKLKAKLVECGISVEQIATKMAMNKATFYRKMQEESFTVKQAIQIADYLDLSHNEIMAIFFEKKVA